MKNVGKTVFVYLVAVIIIGTGIGLIGIANIHGPLNGFAYALGYSIRIFYVTVPLLIGVYFGICKQSSKIAPKQEKNS